MTEVREDMERERDVLEEAALVGARSWFTAREWEAMDDEQRGEEASHAHALLEALVYSHGYVLGAGGPQGEQERG